MERIFNGRVVFQSESSFTGMKYVFVNVAGNKPTYRPKIGGVIQNPFTNGNGKFFEGDLCEYTMDGKIKVLKTWTAQADAAADATTYRIKRDEYRHLIQVGDIIMVAPDTLATTGTGVTVTAVTEGTGYWEITVSATLGAATADTTIFVECKAAGSSKTMYCDNPNAFLCSDGDCVYPTTNSANNVKYLVTPIMGEIAYTSRMADLPSCVTAINRSRVSGWFMF